MPNILNYLVNNNKILILFNGEKKVRKSQEISKHFKYQKVCNFSNENFLYRFGTTFKPIKVNLKAFKLS